MPISEQEARKIAEAHWEYTEAILIKELEQKHFLYVEAMVHGIKHGQESKDAEK